MDRNIAVFIPNGELNYIYRTMEETVAFIEYLSLMRPIIVERMTPKFRRAHLG